MALRQICIGIHAHEQPEQLHATLESVRSHSASTVRLIILPDGPDPKLRQALRGVHDITQLGTEEPLGPPACFNRLVAATDAEVLVLLESGAQVGPGWLDHLLAALAADQCNGLAGPSTNRVWNAQCVFPHTGDTPAAIAAAAAAAARRFGATTRTLEPLYSLADFCYVVRREVVEAIGAADESYGLARAGKWTTISAPHGPVFGGYGPALRTSTARHSRRAGSVMRPGALRRANAATRINFVVCGYAARRRITDPTVGGMPVPTSRRRL
jgi:hypothetical protein